MKTLFSALVLGVFSTVAMAGWISVDKTDDFTDKQVTFARYTDTKHTIQISREDNGVWMYITRKLTGTLEPDTVVELRVDENKTFEVNPELSALLERLGQKASYQWEPKIVGFLIWHGIEEEGCAFIGELLLGSKLRGRYRLNSMERDTFSIPLEGARGAIIAGLDLKICGKP